MKKDVSQFGGVSLAIAAFTCFVLADTSIKALSPLRIPPYEVVAGIGMVEVVFLLSYHFIRHEAGTLRPRNVFAQLFRSSLDLINNLCVVIALRHLPLALFYILVFLAPAATTMMEAFFLNEPLGWKRWLAVTCGFLGVVVAVDPLGTTRSGDRIGYLACMVCVACFSTNMVWSRRLTRTETPQSLALFSAVMMAVCGSTGLLLDAQPLAAKSAAILTGTAAFSVAGSLCFFVALKRVSAATVSQYHYTQLLTGALVAYAMFREKPTAWMYAGAVLIVVSGWLAASIASARREVAPPHLVAAAEK